MTESQRHPAVTDVDVDLVREAITAYYVARGSVAVGEAVYGDAAPAVVAALAAAGRLLPAHAETEYGVQWHGLDVVPVDAERAMSTERRFQNAVAVRRVVGPWQPIPPSEGENP